MKDREKLALDRFEEEYHQNPKDAKTEWKKKQRRLEEILDSEIAVGGDIDYLFIEAMSFVYDVAGLDIERKHLTSMSIALSGLASRLVEKGEPRGEKEVEELLGCLQLGLISD